MFSSHTLFREECIVSQFHLGPRSPPQHPGPVYQVAAWGVPPRTQRQRSGCLHGHAPSIPYEAWPHLTPSFGERKAEWPQPCGWIRGLVWYRGAATAGCDGSWEGPRGLGLHRSRIPGRRVWPRRADSGSLDPELGKEVGPRGVAWPPDPCAVRPPGSHLLFLKSPCTLHKKEKAVISCLS